jgi:acyl-CoA dehydrogenase family protein 9
MAMTAQQVENLKQQADDMMGTIHTLGFAKNLFFGRVKADEVFPYPTLPADKKHQSDEAAAKVRAYAEAHIDHMKIDRESRIPDEVIAGLAKLGVYQMTIPTEFGGLGFGQQQYLKTMEVLGGHCASTAVFVNAHHSIGARALLLFGTKEQQAKWLPGLLDGTKLCAFALTEPEAGSDAGNVQTMATPVEGGYKLNGLKHYITNGGIADILTVMARTPDEKGGTKVTAFLVTPDMKGFEVLEARADKCGIRGTATGKMRFTDMFVPKENVLGPVGKGLRVALTSCTGHAKACIKAMTAHAKRRVQFKQPLAEFELVKKKIAFASAHCYAMEAATAVSAALIDRGAEDYMLETGMLKVFATEHLWTIVNDCIQIHGGKAYFTDVPYERWMRDARINTIGEGANDVLKAFLIAMGGCKAPGEMLLKLKTDMTGGRWSLRNLGSAIGVGSKLLAPWAASTPVVPVKRAELQGQARTLAKFVRDFGTELPHVFLRAGTEAGFAQAQQTHERIADIAIDLFVSACVLSRLDAEGPSPAGRYFLTLAFRRLKANFAALTDNDDAECVAVADAALAVG